MENRGYTEIKTPADAEKFQKVTNGLHDGFITGVHWDNSGIICKGNEICFDYGKRRLVVHILVTSMIGNPIFEIVFQNVHEWRIEEFHFLSMVGFSIVFLGERSLLWADDVTPDIEELKNGSYVVAESIYYRQLVIS